MFACFVCKEKLLYIGFIQWPIWQVNQKELLIGGFMSRVGTVGEWRETFNARMEVNHGFIFLYKLNHSCFK
jgi:hypothetical protein